MTPITYRSDDTSAPTISGTAGALEAALYAILVTGYGSKAAAGWTRDFTGTNKAVFRQGAGLQYSLRIDDADARLARVRGYKTIADVDGSTSTNPFPTDGQISGGLYFRKSITADSTARPWVAWATATNFYIVIFNNLSSLSFADAAGGSGADAHFGFGELENEQVSGDINRAFICAASDTSATNTAAIVTRQCLTSYGSAAQPTLYLNGSYNQASSASTNCYKRAAIYNGVFTQTNSGTSTAPFYPEILRGGLVLSRFVVIEPSGIYRGDLPGIYALLHVASGVFGQLAIIDGVGASTGSSVQMLLTASAAQALAVETSGSW